MESFRRGTELHRKDKESEENNYLILQEIFSVCIFSYSDTKRKEKHFNDF